MPIFVIAVFIYFLLLHFTLLHRFSMHIGPVRRLKKKGKNTRVFASLIVSGRFLHEDSVTESITEKYNIFILFSNLSNSSEMIELKFNYGSVNCD